MDLYNRWIFIPPDLLAGKLPRALKTSETAPWILLALYTGTASVRMIICQKDSRLLESLKILFI